MSAYRDRMASMTVKAVSGDGNVMAVLTRSTNVDLMFRSRSYRRYTDVGLSEQLTGVTKSLFAGRKRARIAIMSELNGYPVTDDDRTIDLDRREREFRVLRAELVAKGTSSGDCVRVSGLGMRDWRVKVRPGTLDKISEEQFIVETRTAFEAFFREHRIKLAGIRRQVYGSALSRS